MSLDANELRELFADLIERTDEIAGTRLRLGLGDEWRDDVWVHSTPQIMAWLQVMLNDYLAQVAVVPEPAAMLEGSAHNETSP